METLVELKVICAWCNKYLRGDVNSMNVSHGICPDCLATVVATL